MKCDLILAPIPRQVIIGADGRAFEVRELDLEEKQAVWCNGPDRDSCDAVVEGLSQEAGVRVRAALDAEYDATAEGIGRILDGEIQRHALRPVSVSVMLRDLEVTQ